MAARAERVASIRGWIPVDWVAESPPTLCMVMPTPSPEMQLMQPISPGTVSEA